MRSPALAAVVCLAPVLALLGFVASRAVEVPFLDDWDSLVGFLVYWLEADDAAGRARLLFDAHNEHRLATPRLALLVVYALTGRIDLTTLDLLGNGLAVLLLATLFTVFRRDDEGAHRLLLFAPAAWLVAQPHAWTAVLSPTVSLSNWGVLAWSTLAFAAAARGGAAAHVVAAVSASLATFSSGNGVLAWPITAAVVWLAHPTRRATAVAWTLAGGLALVLYAAAIQPDATTASPTVSLDRPLRLLRYALNFAGCAAAFSQPAIALTLGGLLLGSFCALVAAGQPRRNPVLFGALAFLLLSIAANALVRAHQGPDAPLRQPRYAIYSASLLAISFLAWAERVRGPNARGLAGVALAVSVGLAVPTFRATAEDVERHADRLREGFDTWWRSGDAGLRHPDFRKATFFLHDALDRGLLRAPESWWRGARPPVRRTPPAPGTAAVVRIDALQRAPEHLLVVGVAQVGGSASTQQVEVGLVAHDAAWFTPAHPVARVDLPPSPAAARRLAGSGFHAALQVSQLPPGRYRLGILVRRDQTEHLRLVRPPITLP